MAMVHTYLALANTAAATGGRGKGTVVPTAAADGTAAGGGSVVDNGRGHGFDAVE